MQTERNEKKHRRSDKILKEAYLALVLCMPQNKITITAITDHAGLNRKTFYSHFETLDDLVFEIEQDYLEKVSEKLDAIDPDDLVLGIEVYYEALDTDDPAMKKLLYGDDSGFFYSFTTDVTSLPFFMHFCREEKYQSLMTGYLSALTGIYLRWKKKAPDVREPLKELAEKSANIIETGLASQN